jgi:oxidase EvaA
VTQSLLLTKEGPGPAPRFTDSAMTADGDTSVRAALDWLAERREAHRFDSVRIPLDEMDDWFFQEGTGNLVHRSGRFFTIEGLRVRTDYGPIAEWDQPIIYQPEIGVLGFIVKEIDGVLHCLMQAKMEPGNINMIQLSPTVQATRSNFTRAHRGSKTRYVEYFVEPGRAKVLVDVLQSEQGAWFFGKRNRNIVVEVTEDVPPHEDFRWMPIGEIHRLLRVDNIVNMDTRSVLSCVPFARPYGDGGGVGGGVGGGGHGIRDGLSAALRRSMSPGEGALHSMSSVLSWFTACAARYELHTERIPLARVGGWRRGPMAISRADGRDFAVIGVRVRADSREVAGWTQPLVAPGGRGIAAFLVKRLGGVLHVLVHARPEAGHMHGVELAPTVECVPDDYRGLPAGHRPRFLDYVEGVPAERVRFDAVQSEEGGRFYNAEGRYMIVEVEDDFPVPEPADYRWLTVDQLTRLVAHRHYVNVQARTLVACLPCLW